MIRFPTQMRVGDLLLAQGNLGKVWVWRLCGEGREVNEAELEALIGKLFEEKV